MQTKVFHLTRGGSKLFVADETFWNNVKHLIFQSEYLEIRLKRGRPIHCLYYGFFEMMEEAKVTELKEKEIYSELGCSYRFAKEDEEFLNYLQKEARKRGVLEYFRG